MRRYFSALALVPLLLAAAGSAAAQNSVYLEELTWTEVRDAIKAGKTTVIIPTGGTEQNGPHMVLGKHNFVVHHNAGEIAKRLGNALVAPTIAYVPEGAVDPPSGGMRYAGTITLPIEHFVTLLEWTARSLKVHGFTDIVLIGDSGGNQAGLKAAAAALNKEWAGTRTRAYHVNDYNDAGASPNSPYDHWLMEQGEKKEDIGSHAGIKDTSNLMAIEAIYHREGQLIRRDKLAKNGGDEGSGVSGDPRRASVEYGKRGLQFRIEAAVKQIQAMIKQR